MPSVTVSKVILDGSLVLPTPAMPDGFQVQFGLPDLGPGAAYLLFRLHVLGPCQIEVQLNSAPTLQVKLKKASPYSFHKIYPVSALSENINQLGMRVTGPGSVNVSDALLLYPVEVAAKAEVDLALDSPAQAFVFRPGGVAGRNVYTEFSSLIGAISSVEGRKSLEFDDSIQRPCVIPMRPGGGAWPMKNVVWAGFAPRTLPGTFRAQVEIQEGARFTELRMFGGSLTVHNRANSVAPVSDFGTGENHVHIGLHDGNTEFVNTGAAAMFELGNHDATFFIQNCLFGVRSTTELVAHSAGICRLQFLGLSLAGENMVRSAAGARVIVNILSSNTAVAEKQTSTTGVLGEFLYRPIARIQRRVLPQDAPAVSPIPIDQIDIPNMFLQFDGGAPIAQALPKIVGGFLLPQSGGKSGYTGGQEIVVAEVGGGANLTVAPSAGDTIDGNTAKVPIAPRGSRTFISDGISNWITISVTP